MLSARISNEPHDTATKSPYCVTADSHKHQIASHDIEAETGLDARLPTYGFTW